MNNLISGRKRPQITTEKRTVLSDIMFYLGLCLMCVMLVIPLSGKTEDSETQKAVPAMSTGVAEREELSYPEEPASAEEWSFFDSIGELFAELIFGKE